MTNNLALCNVTKQCRVSYDSGSESAFIVHRSEKNGSPDLKFVEHQCGLHIWQPATRKAIQLAQKTKDKEPEPETIFVETVEENKKSFTKKEIEGARRARRLYATMFYPTDKKLKWMITHGQIKNCDVTVRDVDVAHQIWGKGIATLKGKMVRKKLHAACPEEVMIPRKQVFEAISVLVF